MKEAKFREKGCTFIQEWYERIDGKQDFEIIAKYTIRERLKVDFPGGLLDFAGFRDWYKGQCQDYTGCHQIHKIEVREENGDMLIFSEIVWKAKTQTGKEIVLFPNVTMRLHYQDGWKVYNYACKDRE